MKFSNKWMRRSKVMVFPTGLAPAIVLVWRGLHQQLGANPVEAVTHVTGDWTLRFLLITLMITPMRRLAGIPDLIRFRRMVGLFAFFYGSLHLLIYLSLDKFFDLNEIVQDIAKRKFITVGLAGLLLMIPLAVTSTAGWIRRLGGRRWQLLHRLVYASAIAGVVHYYWLVKSDIRLPVLYGAILAILLAYRLLISHPRRLLGGNRTKPVLAPRLQKEAFLRTSSSRPALDRQAVVPRSASTL
jgi:sulfoxide reductase heme-binding subunit YedZ